MIPYLLNFNLTLVLIEDIDLDLKMIVKRPIKSEKFRRFSRR